MYSTFPFLDLQTTAASQCLEVLKAVKLLVGMVGGAGEANPTAMPWLLAVTLASLEFTYTPPLHTSFVSYPPVYPSQPAHQHHQKGGRDYPNATLRVLLIPTFPRPVLNEGKPSDPE